MKVLLPSSKYHKYLYLLLIFHTLVYIAFRLLDKSYQTWDSAGHLALSMRFADLIKDFFTGGTTTLYDIATQSNYYPPLIHLLTALLNLVFGYHFVLQLSFIFLMFLLSILLFYKLIISLGYSEKLAFYSAFFYSLMPLVGDQSRLFHLEIPLTLFIIICYHLLLKSKYFTSTKYTYLFFVFFAFTQLIKWYGFLFLIVPVLYSLYMAYKHKQLKNIILPISIGSIIFLLLALPWYILNFEEMRLLSSLFAQGEFDDPKVLWSLQNFTHYARGLLVYQMYLLPLLCTVAGGILLIKKSHRTAIFIFSHISIVYLFFSFIENKNQRYIFVLSLPLAFLSAVLFDSLKNNKIKIFVSMYTLFTFLFLSFNQVKAGSVEAKAWGMVFSGPLYKIFEIRPDLYSYRTYHPPMQEVFDFIIGNATFTDTEDIGITPFVDYERVSSAGLEMFREYLHLDKVYMPVPYYQFEPFADDYQIVKFLRDKNVSYVIVPENPGPEGLRNFKALIQGVDFMKYRSTVWFDRLKSFENEANDLTVYKRKDFDVPIKVNTCNLATGRDFVFTIEPLASLIVFTGHYTYESISKPYMPDTLQILELNNYEVYPKTVTISNLPETGYSYCHRLGTKLKIKKEISAALLSNKYSCRDGTCTSVDHIKINASDNKQREEVNYTYKDFVGNGLQTIFKKLKVLPYYEDEYSIKDEVFIESKQIR